MDIQCLNILHSSDQITYFIFECQTCLYILVAWTSLILGIVGSRSRSWQVFHQFSPFSTVSGDITKLLYRFSNKYNKLKHIVAYVNVMDGFNFGHCGIKVKVTKALVIKVACQKVSY